MNARASMAEAVARYRWRSASGEERPTPVASADAATGLRARTWGDRMDTERVEHESDDLARERTRLAAERTTMAWIRTSLSMIGFGFGIDKIVESLRSSQVSLVARFESGVRWFGIGMVLLGIYAMWASLSEYRRILRAIDTGAFAYGPVRSVASTVGKWLILLGAFALLNLLWRLVHT